MGEGRKYLTGRRWELIGYSWHKNIVDNLWTVMRVFGDGSADPAEAVSYDTEARAQARAADMAKTKRLPCFPPEHPYAVFYTAAHSESEHTGTDVATGEKLKKLEAEALDIQHTIRSKYPTVVPEPWPEELKELQNRLWELGYEIIKEREKL